MTKKLPVQRVLALDGITCVIAGLVMAIGAQALSPMTGLPVELLRYAGLALFPVAALFGWLSRTRLVAVSLVWLAIVGNLAWVAGSILVLELFKPTFLGSLFVLAQATVVIILTFTEWRGINNAQRARLWQ